MNLNNLSAITLEEAHAIQQDLRQKVALNDSCQAEPVNIAGIDVSTDQNTGLAHAVIVVMRRNDFQVLEVTRGQAIMPLPYVPGYLSFREMPAIQVAFRNLRIQPDIALVDGQGIAHPRRFGIACHVGVTFHLPTIGIGKSRLYGVYKEPGLEKGSEAPLSSGGEIIGTVYRSKKNCKPLFISPGHLRSHARAIAVVRDMITQYRLPEPVRLADKYSKIR